MVFWATGWILAKKQENNLSESSSLTLRLHQAENVVLSDGALDVSDNRSGLVVDELDSDLGHSSSRSGSAEDLDDLGELDGGGFRVILMLVWWFWEVRCDLDDVVGYTESVVGIAEEVSWVTELVLGGYTGNVVSVVDRRADVVGSSQGHIMRVTGATRLMSRTTITLHMSCPPHHSRHTHHTTHVVGITSVMS